MQCVQSFRSKPLSGGRTHRHVVTWPFVSEQARIERSPASVRESRFGHGLWVECAHSQFPKSSRCPAHSFPGQPNPFYPVMAVPSSPKAPDPGSRPMPTSRSRYLKRPTVCALAKDLTKICCPGPRRGPTRRCRYFERCMGLRSSQRPRIRPFGQEFVDVRAAVVP